MGTMRARASSSPPDQLASSRVTSPGGAATPAAAAAAALLRRLRSSVPSSIRSTRARVVRAPARDDFPHAVRGPDYGCPADAARNPGGYGGVSMYPPRRDFDSWDCA